MTPAELLLDLDRLKAHKADLLAILRPAPEATFCEPLDKPADALDPRDAWLTGSDEVSLEPCPSCGSLEAWETASYPPRWRCMTCDPPVTALRLLERVEAMRTRTHRIAPGERRAATSTVASTATSGPENANRATAASDLDNANRATVRTDSH